MLLSIGMIVKNEEKYLRDCLTSLKPILEQIQSELIIYDTGSTDSTIEIAKEFTDLVFEIEWRGDFAWARNHPLRKAKGKWYMSIDADTVFQDVSDLISFFTTGEYRNYDMANYRLINIIPNDIPNEFRYAGLFKMFNGIQYVGKIHETIKINQPIVKNLGALAYHYGYNYENEEQLKEKAERNIKPLKEELKHNPNNMRTVAHLVTEYMNIKSIDKALEVIDGVFSVAANKNNEQLYYHVLFHKLILIKILLKAHEDVINLVYEYFIFNQKKYVTLVELKKYQGDAFKALERYEEASEAYKEALELFEQNKQGLLDITITMATIINDKILKDDTPIIDAIVSCYTSISDFKLAKEWSKRSKNFENFEYFETFVMSQVGSKKFEKIAELYEYAQIQEDDIEYDNIIKSIENNFSNIEIKKNIVLAITELENKDMYTALCELCLMHINEEDLKSELEYFINNTDNLPQYYGDIILYAMQTDIDFSQTLENMQIVDSNEFVSNILSLNVNSEEILLRFLEEGDFNNSSLNFKRIISTMGMFAVGRILNRDKPESIIESIILDDIKIRLFETAARFRQSYLLEVYKPEVYCEDMINGLTEGDRFTYYANIALDCRDNNDISGYIKNLHIVLKANPKMKDIIKRIGEILKKREESLKPKQTSDVQMLLEQELTNLKKAISNLLKTGKKEQASMMLANYALINPKDPDIVTMKKIIESGQKINIDDMLIDKTKPDPRFMPLMNSIGKMSENKLFNRICDNFKKLDSVNKAGIEEYYTKYTIWGKLDSKKGIYDTFKERARVIRTYYNDFLELYDRLGDVESKNVLFAILSNWIDFDFVSLTKYPSICPEYFDQRVFPIRKDEVFVDMGAYIGDTAVFFINEYMTYKRIYSYEITPLTFAVMKKNLKWLKNIELRQKAAGDKPGVMYLKQALEPGSNSLTDQGEIEIEVVRIDDDIQEPVTFIKMDIEGAERAALVGCKEQIQKNYPHLAICTYHGYEDIILIPKLIDEIAPGYKFFMRYHASNRTPTEFMILAVKE